MNSNLKGKEMRGRWRETLAQFTRGKVGSAKRRRKGWNAEKGGDVGPPGERAPCCSEKEEWVWGRQGNR